MSLLFKVPSAHLDVLEHVGMVADLLQLHDGVHQGLCSSFALSREMVNGRWLMRCTYGALSSTSTASQRRRRGRRAATVAWRLEIHFLSPRLLRSGVAGRSCLGSGSPPVRYRAEQGEETSAQTHKQTNRERLRPGS